MAEPILVGKRLERFWRQRIRSAGFNPEPFVLKTNRSIIHAPQYVAAMTVFYGMYCVKAEERVAWVHLVAEMQAGKTGVCDALARIIWRNVEDDKMPVDLFHNIFVVTGLSDRTWVRQTRQRLPAAVHVHHSPTLAKMQVQLKALAERPEGLRDVLIIVDESHVASAKKNRPYKHIYSEVRTHLPDPRKWAERNVTFLTVSATDPHKVLMMTEAGGLPAKVVALETTEGYQSVRCLWNAGRIRDYDNIGSTPESIVELRAAVESYETPRYHILRAEGKLNGTTVELLTSAFPEARVLTWDAESRKGAGDGSTSSSIENDINDLLSTAPLVTTFIVIKRMFSCAKTMVDTHVGVLWDYVSVWDDKDSVRLQSLLGRACGYGRSKDTVVYTSMRVVDDYLDHWQEAMRSVERMSEAAPGGNWRNVGVTTDREGKPKQMAGRATPVEPDGPAAAGAGGHASVSHLEEFPSMDALRERWAKILAEVGKVVERAPRAPNYDHEEKCFKCSVGGKSEKQGAHVIRERFPEGSGVANWGSGITDAEPGEYVQRVYAGYEPDGTVVFFLRWTVKA